MASKFFGAFPEANLGKFAAQKLTEFAKHADPLRFPPLLFLRGVGWFIGHWCPGTSTTGNFHSHQRNSAVAQRRRRLGFGCGHPHRLGWRIRSALHSLCRSGLTATIGFVKTGLLADSATQYVGRLAWIPLPELVATEGDPAQLITPELLRTWLPHVILTLTRAPMVAWNPSWLPSFPVLLDFAPMPHFVREQVM